MQNIESIPPHKVAHTSDILYWMKKVTKKLPWVSITVVTALLFALLISLLFLRNHLNPPVTRSYDSQLACEKKLNAACHLEKCDLPTSTPTMPATCAKDSNQGWVLGAE